MKLTGSVPVLSCKSVSKSLAFYKDTLGFVEFKTRKDAETLVWAYLKSGNVYLMLQQDNKPVDIEKQGVHIYFYTDDIDSFHQYLSAKQYQVSTLEITPHKMKQCFLIDPDGYKIQIGETLRK